MIIIIIMTFFLRSHRKLSDEIIIIIFIIKNILSKFFINKFIKFELPIINFLNVLIFIIIISCCYNMSINTKKI